MRLLIKDLKKEDQYTIVGTAIIIFVFRAMPSPGAGLNWFEIDVLGFNQSFFSLLSVTSASITLIGMLILKKVMMILRQKKIKKIPFPKLAKLINLIL